MQLLGFQSHSFSREADGRTQNIHEAKKKKKRKKDCCGVHWNQKLRTKNYRMETEIPRLIESRESVLTAPHEVKPPRLTEFHSQQKRGILQTPPRVNWKLSQVELPPVPPSLLTPILLFLLNKSFEKI